MAQSAPAAIALARSPEYLMPPSAITGVPVVLRRLDAIHDRGQLRHADAGDDARRADRAGTDADLDGVGAAIDQRLGAFGGGDVAGDDLHLVRLPLDAGDRVEHVLRMAMRGVDHDKVDARRDQRLGAGKALVADRGGGGDAQAALLVLAGVRIGDRLLDVLHRDQADAAVLRIDHQQLLDAVLVQQALGFVLADALAHRDELSLVISSETLWRGSVAKRTSRLVRMPTSLPGCALPARSTTGMPEMRLSFIRSSACCKRRIRLDGERVHHHAGFEFLHLAHLRRLFVRLQIAVDHADAAGLRHGDRHLRLGHRVHGGGDDRDIERDRPGDAGADIDVGGHHLRQAGLDQHVVESERLRAGLRCFLRPSPTPSRPKRHRTGRQARLKMPVARGPSPASRPAFGLAWVDSTGWPRFLGQSRIAVMNS